MVDAEVVFREAIGAVVMGLEAAAALVILAAAVRALLRFARRELREGGRPGAGSIRGDFGRSLLLGLDFAIGSDVLKVAVAPTYEQVSITALVVVVRAILTFVLQYEVRQELRDARRAAE